MGVSRRGPAQGVVDRQVLHGVEQVLLGAYDVGHCHVMIIDHHREVVGGQPVAAHDDDLGVLVLSQFTGAARDLTEALIVNPYDLGQAADAMAMALHMPKEEQRERMQSMRKLVSHFNVYRWAGRMLVDAAELRRRERMSGRFSGLATIRGTS